MHWTHIPRSKISCRQCGLRSRCALQVLSHAFRNCPAASQAAYSALAAAAHPPTPTAAASVVLGVLPIISSARYNLQ
jgi:hypothetical protein